MNRVRKEIDAEYAYKRGYFGRHNTIAVLDTGIARHDDLRDQVICFKDFVQQRNSAYDDNGHGTHIAGIIAGSGEKSNGRYMGIAPASDLIILKVMDSFGNGKTERFIQAIDWMIRYRKKYGIRIANLSAGMIYDASDLGQIKLLQAVEQLWEEGIIVMTAAGNNGPNKQTITVPGMLRTVITVGSSDDREIKKRGGRLKAGYSSTGPTRQCIVKPELLAPGTNIVSCAFRNNGYSYKSGTSMATPVAAGAISLLLEKYPYLEPADVKVRLYERLKSNLFPGCWGKLNVRQMMK
ncbi:MAG: S8 family peptidase [Eubacterium sp.]|jgi:Subtilisin-like serine proteases|nr:S8 family peptidase [Eubacterium sp.]